MEPRIQYARASDGVNIAYAVVGAGPPFVMASQIWGSLHMAQSGIDMLGFWSAEELQRLGRRVVVHDARGTGSSDGGPIDYSLSARARDLEAVVQATGVERFPLYGAGHGAATAIAFTVDHPVLVEQLIIVNPFILGAEYYDTNPAMLQFRATESMMAGDWEYFTRSLASGILGFDGAEKVRQLAKAFQSGMRPADVVAFRNAAEFIDLGDLTDRINIPTLVVRDDTMMGSTLARNVAARISGAQFVVGDLKRAVREALHHPASAERSPHPPGGSHTTALILFADIVDSTALSERLGDAAFHERARDLEQRIRAIVERHAGAAVEGRTLGDGVLATFSSAREAITAAMECGQAGQDLDLALHLGLHAGDVMRDAGNVYGIAVNLASRISAISNPNELLISGAVREIARASVRVTFQDRGEHALKGIDDPVRVFAVTREGGAIRGQTIGPGALGQLRNESVQVRVQREVVARDGVWAIEQLAMDLSTGLCPKEIGSKSHWHGSFKWDELQRFCGRLKVLGLVEIRTREHTFANRETELWETFYLNDEGARLVREITGQQKARE